MSGAEPGSRRTIRRLATPISFNDLIRLLDDPSPAIRLEAINCIEAMNRPATSTIPALTRLFEDPDPIVRVEAVRVAIRAGLPAQDCVPIAVQLLIPERPDVFCRAALILGGAGPAARSALPQLDACLTASSRPVRLHAAHAALRIDPSDTAALDVWRTAQENGRGDTTRIAATALREGVAESRSQTGPAGPIVCARVNPLERLGTSTAQKPAARLDIPSDGDLLARAQAARAAQLAGAPPHQIVGIASALLVPERPDVVRVAASILADVGPAAADALPGLHACLNAQAPEVRLYAAESVLRIDPNDLFALDELQSALDQPQSEVRYFAVNALGAAARDSDHAMAALQRALGDRHRKVATAAALHLSRTHELARQSVPAELRPSKTDFARWISELSQSAVDTRRAAASHFITAGPAAHDALPALIDHLGDRDPIVQLHVAQAIWEIDRKGHAILPLLFDLLLTNRGNARIGAVYLLGQMGPDAIDTLPWLTRLLNDSRSYDRLLLAAAISRIDPTRRSANEILVGGVYHANADVRYLSVVALSAAPLERFGEADQALRVVVADRQPRVRRAAGEALGQWEARIETARAAQPSPRGLVMPAAASDAPGR